MSGPPGAADRPVAPALKSRAGARRPIACETALLLLAEGLVTSRRSHSCRARPAAGRSRPCRRRRRPRPAWRSPARTAGPPARTRSTSPRSPAARPCRRRLALPVPSGKSRCRSAVRSLPCAASAWACVAISSVKLTSPLTAAAIMPRCAPLALMKALRYLTRLAGSSAAKAAAAPRPEANRKRDSGPADEASTHVAKSSLCEVSAAWLQRSRRLGTVSAAPISRHRHDRVYSRPAGPAKAGG